MATILKYRDGNLVPVKVEKQMLGEYYSSGSASPQGKTVYFQSRSQLSSKRFYGNLVMIFLVANATVAVMLLAQFV